MPIVTARDDVDGYLGELTPVITKSGSLVSSLNTNSTGTYILTYTATDKAGNENTLEIRVTVRNRPTSISTTTSNTVLTTDEKEKAVTIGMTVAEEEIFTNFLNAHSITAIDVYDTKEKLAKLSTTSKAKMKENFYENMPYTSLNQQLTYDILKDILGSTYSDKEILSILANPSILEEVGVKSDIFSNAIVLSPTKDAIFIDVAENHWASVGVKEMTELGIVVGDSNGAFNPRQPLVLADTFTFLDRFLLINDITDMKLSRSTVEEYITNENNWAYNSIASIASKLTEDTLMDIAQVGSGAMTRGLLAQVIYELVGNEIESGSITKEFADISASEYKEAIDYCIQAGILNGTSENTMEPEKAVTRAEMVTILSRMQNKLN
ncbi:MAG: hypothetical protein BEN19_04800 [Epulopiscium sp. Nuni2H_MBin003]|nr:MAG: hypothetical protein BEN19_04800 [Epulopiscium sp. Nuni2H_MBin003]